MVSGTGEEEGKETPRAVAVTYLFIHTFATLCVFSILWKLMFIMLIMEHQDNVKLCLIYYRLVEKQRKWYLFQATLQYFFNTLKRQSFSSCRVNVQLSGKTLQSRMTYSLRNPGNYTHAFVPSHIKLFHSKFCPCFCTYNRLRLVW